ncbi:fatty acid desaturase [Stackebrandtia soli]|uniref:fatty acid desaturase n=1 Tax=Stackebrandtia soli TaxID=1892856 RepID=UPI0039EA3C08
MVIVGVIVACELMLSGWTWWVGYLLIALPIIATRQRALATLLHEAAHGVLTRNRRLGVLLATWPSGYLILQSHRTYQRSHLRDHHGAFGNPYIDPDLRAHLAHGLYEPMSARTFTLKYLLAPLFGVRTPRLIAELITQRLSGTRREVLAGLGVVAYFAAVGGVLFACGLFDVFVVYWLVPLFLVFPLVNWYIELLEHFPMVGNEYVDILTSRPRATGPITRHLFGIHGEGYHLDHHLSPKIPYWNLRRAHEIRTRDARYHAAVLATAPPGRGLLWQFRDMARQVGRAQSNTRLRAQLDSLTDAPTPVRAA